MRHLSGEHVAALLATVAVAMAAVVGARRSGGVAVVRLSRALAALIAAGYLVEQATYVARGRWSAEVNVPLHLTDVVTLVAVVALWAPRPILVEALYLWALTASLQAVITPDLGYAFPDVLYFTFFVTHSGVVVGALLLVFGRGLVPRPGVVGRVFALTVGVAALAAVGCVVTGGNYMYLREKPDDGSLLDAFGPWPWYLAGAGVLGLVLFTALAALARAVPAPSARPAGRSS